MIGIKFKTGIKNNIPKYVVTSHTSNIPNKFKIEVTAQNKDSRVYELTVTRTDNRTGDLTLKTLQVTGTNLKVVKDQTTYETTVSRSVDKILIAARTNDPMATLTGTGQKELQIGLNTFEILVESANGLEQIYTINIFFIHF